MKQYRTPILVVLLVLLCVLMSVLMIDILPSLIVAMYIDLFFFVVTQLLVCSATTRFLFRAIPPALMAAASAACYIGSVRTSGWDSWGLELFAFLALIYLGVLLLTWGAYLLFGLVKKALE